MRPEGYAPITPYLLYADATGARDFLVEAFGFAEIEAERHTDDAGRLVHTALLFDGQVVMIGSPGPAFAGPAEAGVTVHLYAYVDDLDAHFERARAAGAQIAVEPETAPYGDRRYQALDPEGHAWWFASAGTAPTT